MQTRDVNRVRNIYDELFHGYGPQGWWPLLECDGTNPTKTGSIKGYHPGDYAYTKRIFANIGLIAENASYGEVQSVFEQNLPPDLVVYQEYHALLVEHAKRHYGRGADYALCPLYQRQARCQAPFEW